MSVTESSSTGRLRGVGASRLHVGIFVAQALVAVSYFVSWHRFATDALMVRVYSQLTHDPASHTLVLMVTLIVCFVATVAGAMFTAYSGFSRGSPSHVRASSLLNSVAIAAPLMYLQTSLGLNSDWSDLFQALSSMGVGWFMAMSFGTSAGAGTLYLLYRVCGPTGEGHAARERRLARPYGLSAYLASAAVVILGTLMVVIGFYQTWYSGTFTSIWRSTGFWSYTGIETSVLMFVVPACSALASALFIASRWMGRGKRLVCQLACESLLLTCLSLVVSWGLFFCDAHMGASDFFLSVDKLGIGWYLSVVGLLAAFVCALVYDTSQPDALRRRPR